MGNRIIDRILLFVSELFGLKKDHSDRITNKLTSGIAKNDIFLHTVGNRVYLTGDLMFATGKMPINKAVYLGTIPEELMPFNDMSVVFATHGQILADTRPQIRLAIGNRGIQFYNSGSEASGAEIFYYATWELEKIPSGGGSL